MTDRTGPDGSGFEGDGDRSPEQMQLLYDLVFDTSMPLKPPPRPEGHYVDMDDIDRTGEWQSDDVQSDLSVDQMSDQFGEITEEVLDEELFTSAQPVVPIAELAGELKNILADLTLEHDVSI